MESVAWLNIDSHSLADSDSDSDSDPESILVAVGWSASVVEAEEDSGGYSSYDSSLIQRDFGCRESIGESAASEIVRLVEGEV